MRISRIAKKEEWKNEEKNCVQKMKRNSEEFYQINQADQKIFFSHKYTHAPHNVVVSTVNKSFPSMGCSKQSLNYSFVWSAKPRFQMTNAKTFVFPRRK